MKPIKIRIPGGYLPAFIMLLATAGVRGQCFPSAANNCSFFSNVASVGAYAWSNPGGAQFPDASYANVGVLLGLFANVNSNYLVAENPGFNIPAYATICGIEVAIDESAFGIVLGTKVSDHSVKIVKGNAIGGTEHASAAAWTGAGGYVTYGGPADLWGLGWLPADVNAANFGVGISVNLSFGLASVLLTANINNIKIKVYYDSSAILSSSSIRLTAMKAPGRINLQWQDPTNSNNRYFTVEKSADSHVWENMDSVPVLETKAASVSYYAIDQHPAPQNYYRLRQADMNGQQKLSDILSVPYSDIAGNALDIYPNPAHGAARISATDRQAVIRAIKVVDLMGRTVQASGTPAGSSGFNLDTSQLPPGIYLVQAFMPNEIISSRLVVR